jgi:hypothetical protein
VARVSATHKRDQTVAGPRQSPRSFIDNQEVTVGRKYNALSGNTAESADALGGEKGKEGGGFI